MSSIMLERSCIVKGNLFREQEIVARHHLRTYTPTPPLEPRPKDDVVTTGIGFKCEDGIVLVTDAQYSTALKIKGEKLFEISGREDLKLCIAGSGNVSHILKAIKMIGTELPSNIYTMDDIIEVVETSVQTIYKKYIDIYPIPEERPFLELLVGIWSSSDGLSLFKTDRNAAMPVKRYDVIGTGGILAQYIIETLSEPWADQISDAKLLGMYALKAAKEYDGWTGKGSQIKILHKDGKIENPSEEEVGDTEHFFEQLFSSIKSVLWAISYSDIAVEDIESMADLKRVIGEFRERLEKRRTGCK